MVIDLGAAAFMGTDLIFQERRNAVLPEDVAIDIDGKPTRDPARVHAILPFGGYKGFALGLAMQASACSRARDWVTTRHTAT